MDCEHNDIIMEINAMFAVLGKKEDFVYKIKIFKCFANAILNTINACNLRKKLIRIQIQNIQISQNCEIIKKSYK